jgi:hypothetical protein
MQIICNAEECPWSNIDISSDSSSTQSTKCEKVLFVRYYSVFHDAAIFISLLRHKYRTLSYLDTPLRCSSRIKCNNRQVLIMKAAMSTSPKMTRLDSFGTNAEGFVDD